MRAHVFHTEPEQLVRRLENPARQIGWIGHSGEGRFYRLDETGLAQSFEPGGFSPVYIEVGD